MKQGKRVGILLAVIAVVVILDQATKVVAARSLGSRAPLIFAGDLFRFQYAENPGAFLSLGARLSGSAQQWIFIGIVSLLLAGLLLFTLMELQRLHWLLVVAFGLMIGGGLGNLIDRLVNDGRVRDFMNIGIGGLRTGIFNVADMALMAGLALIALLGHRLRQVDLAPRTRVRDE